MKFIKWLVWLMVIFLITWLIWHTISGKKNHIVAKRFINWNFVLNPSLTPAQRDSVVKQILKDVNNVSNNHLPATDSFSLYFYGFIYGRLDSLADRRRYRLGNASAYYCACKDSLLWNLQADLEIDGSGGSIPTTTKPKSTGAQGGVDFISNNDTTFNPLSGGSILQAGKTLNYPDGAIINDSGFVALIDTGIDSLMLEKDIRNVIIPFGENGSQNTMIGAKGANFMDSNEVRHGTSVSSIVMNEYHRLDANKKVPKLMVLKALDDSGKGDLFSMSCAIMHAIDGHAKLINISAGYYGKPDSVLNHYLQLSRAHGIPVIAAAGNFEGPRNRDICTDIRNPKGLLSDILFFPACMSIDTAGYSVIAVTGLKSPTQPCYYQNYSDQYVTVGLINKSDKLCCAFNLSFFTNGIALEGTSFATPVITGRLGHALMNGLRPAGYSDLLRGLQLTLPNPSLAGAPKRTRFFTNN